MNNIADLLCEKIITKRSPIVIGLDPDITRIPECYIKKVNSNEKQFSSVSNAIIEFNKDIIDTISDLVPAVKPQIAFYEQYGSYGMYAFEETVRYAKHRGLIVIEDGKRNDIGNTATAYANGHLGTVEVFQGSRIPSYDVDFLTVTPFLGSESLAPFIETCIKHNKGIFILARTSNSTSGEIQEAILNNGDTVSTAIGKFIAARAELFCGEHGYSSIGAVVGATYPQEARMLRKVMPKSIFLVPGYGAQGAKADDIVPNFNDDGLGAIVNASRSILYSYEKKVGKCQCSRQMYVKYVQAAVRDMQQDIYSSLEKNCKNLLY